MTQFLKDMSVAILKGAALAAAAYVAIVALYFAVVFALILAMVELGYDFVNIMSQFRAILDRALG